MPDLFDGVEHERAKARILKAKLALTRQIAEDAIEIAGESLNYYIDHTAYNLKLNALVGLHMACAAAEVQEGGK